MERATWRSCAPKFLDRRRCNGAGCVKHDRAVRHWRPLFACDHRQVVAGLVQLTVRNRKNDDVGLAHHARVFAAGRRTITRCSCVHSQHLQADASERKGEPASHLAGADDEYPLAHSLAPACCISPALCSASACECEAPRSCSAAINTRSSCAFRRNSASAPNTYRATSYANSRETSGAASSNVFLGTSTERASIRL